MNWTILLPRERRKYIAAFVASVLACFVRCSSAQDFRIDNQVKIQSIDCYTRIAIGSRMPDSAVISTVPANSLSDCEAACSGNRTVCDAFSFGIDARGNGTCTVGRMDLNTRGNDLVIDPDYDVYERRVKMPRGCRHDRLLRIGFGARMPIKNSSNANNTSSSRQQANPQVNGQGIMMMVMNGAPKRRPQNPFGNSFAMRTMPSNDLPRDPSFFRGGWYSPIADDSDSRLYDIINNKKKTKSNQWEQAHQHIVSPHEHYSDDHHSELHSHVQIHDEDEHNYYLHRSSVFGPGSSGIGDKWNSDGYSKWIERNAGLRSKWTEAVPNLDLKWNERSGNFRPKWRAGFPAAHGIQRDIFYPMSTISTGLKTHGSFPVSAGLGFPKGLHNSHNSHTVHPVNEKIKHSRLVSLVNSRQCETRCSH